MLAVTVEQLVKNYRVHARGAGIAQALSSIFRRRYDTLCAVDHLSFSIEQGERVGFLGPNGAGKTTTLKMLAGLLHPSSGVVRVGAFIPTQRERAFLSHIMLVMGQKQQLMWDLPPVETFELNRAIYGIDRGTFRARLQELNDLLQLEEVARRPTRQLSLGERMKCEVAAALLHQPKVLFLDEPTIGLDVAMQITIRDFIRTYSERHGATVLLTSHYMNDVLALCPRVIAIDHGQLTFDGRLTELVQRSRPEKTVVIHFEESPLQDSLADLGEIVALDETSVRLRVRQADVADVVARALQRIKVRDLSIEDPPLEQIVSHLFAQQARKAKVEPT